MDQGAWLWKKKTLEKTNAGKYKSVISSKGNKEEKTLQDKLACLLNECNAKDELVSSHSKAAQEAMAGWEKAEAEAKLRKQKLDEALQKKIEEREKFYADLKDCVRLFLISAKEEEEKRINEAVEKATKELENKHKNLEEKYVETSRMVAALTFENSQLTTALQVKEKFIDDINEQMSKVNGELNELMTRFDLSEKENVFLKSEYQKLEKDLQIRNEEIEFNHQSAEASEKKKMENLRKIKKLESECRRLRVLIRKRLLGPAAEMQGCVAPPEVCDRRISFMSERVCDVEEENKILKEIANSKDEEVCSLRNAFSLLVSKLSQVEDQLGDSSKTQKSMELINGFGSWASALLSQLENFERGERENAYERRMNKVSDNSQMDDFVETEKLALLSVNPQCEDSCKSSESSDLMTKIPSGWIQKVSKEILEQTRVSQRSVYEILDDIRVALKYTDTANIEDISEQSFERLKLELESLQESKKLLQDQIEKLKLINEDLDTQLTVSRVQSNELLQKISNLEAELEERRQCCEELEDTCLKLQRQLKSVSSKELTTDDEEKDEDLFHAKWEITEVDESQETTLNHGTQLKAASDFQKNTAVLDKVLSATSDTTLSQRSSLRDCLAEDGFELGDPSSPKTKEIISTSEMKISPIVESNEVKTSSVPAGMLAIVPTKKRSGGFNLLRKIFFRRKKGVSMKKSRYRSSWQI